MARLFRSVAVALAVAGAFAARVQASELESLFPRLAGDNSARQRFEDICLNAARPGAEQERQAASASTAALLLAPNATPDVRVFLLRQLQQIGGAEAVPYVARLLNEKEPEVRDAARRALEAIPAKEAGEVLRAMLAKTDDPAWRVALLNALGARRDEQAAPAAAKLLSDKDPKVVAAAAAALGKIGGPEAAKALSAAKSKVPQEIRPAVIDAYLQCADLYVAEGYYDEAIAIYKEYAQSENNLLRIAALQGLVAAETARKSGKPAKRVAKAPAKPTTSAAETDSAAPKKALPEIDSAVLEVWDAKLRKRASAALKGGARPAFPIESLRKRVTVTGLADDGTLSASAADGGAVTLPWSRLTITDKRYLALGVLDDDPRSHALAAFYLFATGNDYEAGKHLKMAGDEADAVKEAFKK